MKKRLPPDFEVYTSQLFGEERYQKFLLSFEEDAPTSVRLNPFKVGKKLVEAEPIPWCKDGFWLSTREDFTLDPLFHAGCYYVQEAGSMFLDTVLRQYVKAPVTMLDLCAAPGGKATLARATLPKGSLLFCNEIDRRRANVLLENIQKQGHRDVVVTSNTPMDYLSAGQMFDVILADVPCSGEGMFRKDEKAIGEWSIKNVVRSAELQRSIVRDIWPCLKSNGILIYSTCTFNTRENEENVCWIADELGAEVLSVKIKDGWGLTGSLLKGFSLPIYRFIPGITRSEGLFMAVMRKTKNKENTKKKRGNHLHILYDGRNVGSGNDKKLPPKHAEALLYDFPKECFPQVELAKDEALRYLRHESISLTEDAPRGFVVVTYEGHALGFVKNIGTRANNLYPQEWRIRNK